MHNLIMVLVLAFCFTGCNTPKKVTAVEFQELVSTFPTSIKNYEFVGVRDGSAFMKVSTMSLVDQAKWNDQYYFTDEAGLPKEWLQEQVRKAGTKVNEYARELEKNEIPYESIRNK